MLPHKGRISFRSRRRAWHGPWHASTTPEPNTHDAPGPKKKEDARRGVQGVPDRSANERSYTIRPGGLSIIGFDRLRGLREPVLAQRGKPRCPHLREEV